MHTEVARIRKPDPHVHEGDPNPVHTEVAKMAVFGSDICADLSGSCRVASMFVQRGHVLLIDQLTRRVSLREEVL